MMKFWPSKESSFYKLKALFALGVYGFVAAVAAVVLILAYFSTQVPDYRTLAEYSPRIITKVYDRNGELLAEYARERRIYTPIEEIPLAVKNAYLAAEDDRFYNHSGFDVKGIFRAALNNIVSSHRQGASTITQQVAKTFFLSSERTYTRKIKELILSRRMEQSFSKDKILELYLNQIFLGNGAYGVTAAAMAYYGKELSELEPQELAMLAGLPKAPSAFNPVTRPQEARYRRDVVLGRMFSENFITREEYDEALRSDLNLNTTQLMQGQDAPHFSEHVRRFVLEQFGDEALYGKGYVVHTTLDKQMQQHAEDAVYQNLRDYDRRHGYRGAVGKMTLLTNWQARLESESRKWTSARRFGAPAVVLSVDDNAKTARIGLPKNEEGVIELASLEWARAYIDANTLGPRVTKVSDVLSVNDIILVKPISDVRSPAKGAKTTEGFYSLEQIPQAQGSLMAIDPETGAILAMVGGLDEGVGFNRAVQSRRQVGSSIKPFVYALALEKGFTPASILLDAPVVLHSDELADAWKPRNYSERVYGESTLRLGIEKSRNLMTIRLARELGMGPVVRYIRKYGITSEMERNLSTALGSSSISLLELTNAYGVFANGGRLMKPYAVNAVYDAKGNIIYREHDACFNCTASAEDAMFEAPKLPTLGTQIIPETVAFQMAYLLQGIVQNGTSWRAKEIRQPVGAKTGTTNDFIDAWLMGIAPNMAIGSWIGFDRPQTLGRNESGSSAAAPIWVDFARPVFAKEKEMLSYKVPEGITFVQIDTDTGLLPNSATKSRMFEAFIKGSEPKTSRSNLRNQSSNMETLELQGIY